MRQKFITALSLFFVLSLLFTVQTSFTAQAFAHENNNHITPTPYPVTNPVTGPVTGPITGPVSNLFAISGNVSYHIFGLFKRGIGRFAPAAGVIIKACDIFTNHTVTTTTDKDGNYTLNPGKAGLYKVTASGGEASFYAPPVQVINDKKPAGVQHVNFQGIMFKF
jgi:hypothetical protein